MRLERGWCGRCRKNAVERHGEAQDGRPQYRCTSCGNTHTRGHQGEPWDSHPSPTKKAAQGGQG